MWTYLLAGWGLGVATPFLMLMGFVAVDWIKARSAARRVVPPLHTVYELWQRRVAESKRLKAGAES